VFERCLEWMSAVISLFCAFLACVAMCCSSLRLCV
jgi:hypothetical protein